MKKIKLYKIQTGFAKYKQIPIFFSAIELAETQKAIYLYGHGTTQTTKMGICMNCGRELTHPVSVELGIGPICGGHYHDWDLIGGYTLENIERLKTAIKEITIDTWIPRSKIEEVRDSEDEFVVPENHPMMKPKEPKSNKKQALLVRAKDKKTLVIKIVFPFDFDTLAQVKSLPGRKYHSEKKVWSCPLSVENCKELQEWGFELAPNLNKWYVSKTVGDAGLKASDMKPFPEIPGLGGTLRNFQSIGVRFVDSRDGNALIADDMGLGKTVQALAYLQLRQKIRPAIIVTPSNAKLNWMREANKWLSGERNEVQILRGQTPYDVTGDIIILNYDILPYWVDELFKIKARILIADECQNFKNNKAKRTKAIKRLRKKIPKFLPMSGTPIENRPIEIYNAVNMVDPTLFPSFWHFAQRYCGAKHNGFGWDFNGSSNTQELHNKLINSIMIRRMKSEVLTELPDKTYAHVPLELANDSEYREAERDFVDYATKVAEIDIREKLLRYFQEDSPVEINDHKLRRMKEEVANKINVLTEIEGLKQLAVREKLPEAISWIRDFIDQDKKLVLFAEHHFVIDALKEEFKDVCVKFDGRDSETKKDNAIQQFQNDPKTLLFIGQTKAAGVAITLTAASDVAVLELPWNPGKLDQAVDRVHRMTQKNAVTVYYLLAFNTIEERIARLIDSKRTMIASVMDGKDMPEVSLITELISEYANAA